MGWLKRLIDDDKDVSMMGTIPAYHNFMMFGNRHDTEAGLPEVWKVNGDINIPWLDKNKDRVIGSVLDLPDLEGKCIILVGASPVLNKSWEALKDINDRFVIVATNSSAQFLKDKGIIPHYVIAIDGAPGSWSLDLGESFKDVVGLFSAYVEPQALRDWPGKIMIIPYKVKDRNLYRKVKRRWGEGMASGGNSLNGAFSVFVFCTEARIFLFAGNELSFKDRYYADRESPNDEHAYFFTKNIYGEKVKTFIPLYEYKIWLENGMAQLYPKYHFCNCSEGILGVDVDGELYSFISHKPLDLAISEIKEAWDFEEQPLQNKLKEMYCQFYDHDFGNMKRGVGMWKYIIQHHSPFKKGLDVGCGRANGVEHARGEGYDVHGCDIAESAIKCWIERGVNDYCSVCTGTDMPYEDNEFDVVLCSEVMEHVPEDDVLSMFKEILRVGSNLFIFTISLIPEKIPLAGYIQTHITVKPPNWWFKKFEEAGYNIIQAGRNEGYTGITVVLEKTPSDLSIYEDKPLIVMGSGEERPNKYADFADL